MRLPRMYTDLARWWPLLSAPADYAEEAAAYAEVMRTRARGPVRAVLELGSGGGNTASHLSAFDRTLVDLSEDMLAVSRALNPSCEHVRGDMRSVRLGRTFDAVLIQDAIMYMTTEHDLRAAITTAAEHVRSGGVVVLVPDDTTETYEPATNHGGHDGEAKAMRYLEWRRAPEPGTTRATVTYVYVLDDGCTMAVEHEHHTIGVFPRATWLRLVGDAGLVPASAPYPHSEFTRPHELFVGVKP